MRCVMKRLLILLICIFCVCGADAKPKKPIKPAQKQIVVKDTIEIPKLQVYKEEDFGIKFGDDKNTVIDILKNRPYVKYDPENQDENKLTFAGGYFLKCIIKMISVNFKNDKLISYIIAFSPDEYLTPQDAYNDIYNNLTFLMENQYNIEGEIQKNDYDYVWKFSNCWLTLKLMDSGHTMLNYIYFDF